MTKHEDFESSHMLGKSYLRRAKDLRVFPVLESSGAESRETRGQHDNFAANVRL